MRHFEKELNSQLPTGPPWECPFPNCKVEPKDNLHYLRLHYGIEHNVARQLYDEKINPKPKPAFEAPPASVPLYNPPPSQIVGGHGFEFGDTLLHSPCLSF